MDPKRFDRLVESRLKKCQSVLATKDKEYSSGADRLHNFKRAARIRKTYPENSLDGMFQKHLVSYLDCIDSLSDPFFCPSENWVNEKVGDIINYMLLFEGMLQDRRDNLDSITRRNMET